MRASLLLLSVALLGPATGMAQEETSPIAIHVASGEGSTEELRAVREGLRGALGASAPWVSSRACLPSADPACVRALLGTTGAAHLLVATIAWERGPCVPMRGANGEITGRRMLRTRTLRLDLYGSDGARLATSGLPIRDTLAAAAVEDEAEALLVRALP
jgi:hypothetical protein